MATLRELLRNKDERTQRIVTNIYKNDWQRVLWFKASDYQDRTIKGVTASKPINIGDNEDFDISTLSEAEQQMVFNFISVVNDQILESGGDLILETYTGYSDMEGTLYEAYLILPEWYDFYMEYMDNLLCNQEKPWTPSRGIMEFIHYHPTMVMVVWAGPY